MASFTLIAAIGPRGELGYKGDLIYHNKTDMKFFTARTTGSAIICGRKTFESFKKPNGLPGRMNIVLSSSVQNTQYDMSHDEGVVYVSSIKDAISLATIWSDLHEADTVYIVGGANVYNQFICGNGYKCDHIILSEFMSSTPENADVYLNMSAIMNRYTTDYIESINSPEGKFFIEYLSEN